MTKKIKSRRAPRKRVTFSNLQGGKSDYYQPGKYPFTSAQFFKKSNLTSVPLVKKRNVSTNLSSKNVKALAPVVALKTNSSSKTGGRSLQDPANAQFTSNVLKTTNSRGSVIDTDKFNRQWNVRKQFANYPMNAGIYASAMPAAKSNTSGGGRGYKKSRKTNTKKTTGGYKKGKNKSKSKTVTRPKSANRGYRSKKTYTPRY